MPRTKKPHKDALVMVRLTEAQKEAIVRRAEFRGVPVSAYVRDMIERENARPLFMITVNGVKVA